MNLRWLSAPDDEATAAMRNVRTSACPPCSVAARGARARR